MAGPPSEPAWWHHLRAVLVIVHLVAVIGVALPSVGGGMRRSAWKSPTVQQEFAAWTQRLQAVGLSFRQEALENRLWDFAVAYERGRQRVLGPLQIYYDVCGTWQSWRMFVAPHRYPGRLLIEIDRGDGFEALYEARSPEHTWHRRWFDHDRWRAAIFRYSWAHYKSHRGAFTTWVARVAARDFPEAKRVRVSFLRYRTRSPTEVREGKEAKTKRELANGRLLSEYRQ